MSNSVQRVVSDGTLTLLNVSLNYFSRGEIKVYLDGLNVTTGWAWVGTTDKQIQFTTAVAAGVEVMLRRITDVSAVLNVFSTGAKFDQYAMDDNFTQMLHIAQEMQEGSGVSAFFADVDMHNYSIRNLHAGIQSTDAANVGQVEGLVEPYANQAAVQAASAQVSADSAYASELSTVQVFEQTNALYGSMVERLANAVTNNYDTGASKIASGTTAQRAQNGTGSTRWNTDLKRLESYDSGTWLGAGGGGATGGGADDAFYENTTTITTNYTITSGKNAGTFGPVTVNSGVTVTVPEGSSWTVIG